MVKILDINKKAFEDLILGRRLVCFGLGKLLKIFIEQNPRAHIDGIVDNYNYEQTPYLDYMGNNIPVWSIMQFEKNIANDEIIIVVTTLAVEEIVDQLDKMKSLNDVPCCIALTITGYDVENEIRTQLMETVFYLAHRTEESVEAEYFKEINKNQLQKRYQIWEYFRASNIGGSKARTDIKNIIGSMGYQVIKVHTTIGTKGTSVAACSERLVRADWLQCLDMISENSYILLQHPAPQETRLPEDILWRIKNEKKARIICLVHEVEELRKEYATRLRQTEFRIMKKLSDVFIVHNEAMRHFYIQEGVSADKVISLQIFDYINGRESIGTYYEKSITIAGNLNLGKSAYLKELGKLFPLKIHLYGPNFSETIIKNAPNIEYHGSIAPDVLPEMLNKGFGLVWDGESLDTCTGGCGEYLRYNNPHKLSLYLSSGLPVIIWKQAAEAEFVIKNHVGIVVDSLYELNVMLDKMTLEEYKVLAENAKKISVLLGEGTFTKEAVRMAEVYFERIREK